MLQFAEMWRAHCYVSHWRTNLLASLHDMIKGDFCLSDSGPYEITVWTDGDQAQAVTNAAYSWAPVGLRVIARSRDLHLPV